MISNDSAPVTLTLMGSEIAGLAKVATTLSASSLVIAGWLISAGNAMGPVDLQETARDRRRRRILLQHRSFLGLLLLDLRTVVSDRGINRFLIEGLGEPTDCCLSLAWSTTTTASMADPPVSVLMIRSWVPDSCLRRLRRRFGRSRQQGRHRPA